MLNPLLWLDMSHLIKARDLWGTFHKRYTGVPLVCKELLHHGAATDAGLCNQCLGNKQSQLSTILVANSHMDKRAVCNCKSLQTTALVSEDI